MLQPNDSPFGSQHIQWTFCAGFNKWGQMQFLWKLPKVDCCSSESSGMWKISHWQRMEMVGAPIWWTNDWADKSSVWQWKSTAKSMQKCQGNQVPQRSSGVGAKANANATRVNCRSVWQIALQWGTLMQTFLFCKTILLPVFHLVALLESTAMTNNCGHGSELKTWNSIFDWCTLKLSKIRLLQSWHWHHQCSLFVQFDFSNFAHFAANWLFHVLVLGFFTCICWGTANLPLWSSLDLGQTGNFMATTTGDVIHFFTCLLTST